MVKKYFVISLISIMFGCSKAPTQVTVADDTDMGTVLEKGNAGSDMSYITTSKGGNFKVDLNHNLITVGQVVSYSAGRITLGRYNVTAKRGLL